MKRGDKKERAKKKESLTKVDWKAGKEGNI
jgi:hypothetical protein